MITDITKSKLANLLSSIKSKDGKHNLLEHLNKMYLIKAQMNNDELFNDCFEDISQRIKKNCIPLFQTIPRPLPINSKEKNLLKPLVKIEPENEPVPITQINFVPDYIDIFTKLSFAGISFGDKESLLINTSLRNLSSTLQGGNVTFFGKIRGTLKDYYIAEATEIEPPAEAIYDADMEKRKEDGINRNVFYVTNDLSDKWEELPDVKPSMIIASRKIRYILTGDLNRQIYSNPYFFGKEKHYLRCQIARIYHGTKLVPSVGHFTVEDPEQPFKQLTPSEKQKPFTNEEISDMKTWIHFPPSILNCGRVSHFIDETPEGVDPDEYRKKIMDKDPFEKRIKPITNDKGIESGFKSDYIEITPWRLDQYYENNIYINPYIKMLDENSPDFDPNEQKDNKANYTITVVRSLRWPGAINVYMGKESYFFYIGDGLKFRNTITEGIFNYKKFPTIPNDLDDKEDQPEPHEGVAGNPEGEVKKENEEN